MTLLDDELDYDAPHHLDPQTFITALAYRPEWWLDAACLGTAESAPQTDAGTFWFPTRGESVDEQKAICSGCPVASDCREYAITNVSRQGIWGGLSERERRWLRHRRRCDVAGCTNSAHDGPAPDPFAEAQVRLGVKIDPRFAALWRRKRAPRRASFGSGSAASRAYAKALVAARAS